MSVAEKYSEIAYARLLENEEMFSGICDEIKISDGNKIRFVFGAFNYDLTSYNVAFDPIGEVLFAVKRVAPYYAKKNRELQKKNNN